MVFIERLQCLDVAYIFRFSLRVAVVAEEEVEADVEVVEAERGEY